MRRGLAICLKMAVLLGLGACSAQQSLSQAVSVQSQPLSQQQYSLPQAEVFVVKVPGNSGYTVRPAVSESLQTLTQWQQQTGAIAAINAGFFDPENQQTTSYVTVQGRLVADPQQNDRLMQNPNLTAYLPQILQRSEWRRYQCQTGIRYDIVAHSSAVPSGCQMLDALAAGPQLLPHDTAEAEAFITRLHGEVVRDAIGSRQPNARSAIGLMPDGTLLLVMVAQRPQPHPAPGMTLMELADFMKTLGVTQALNLDGGSSASLVYQTQAWYGKLNPQGERVRRPVKSILLVKPEQQ